MSYWTIGYKEKKVTLVDGDCPFEFMKDAVNHVIEQYEEDWSRRPEPEELIALFSRALPGKWYKDLQYNLSNLYPDVG